MMSFRSGPLRVRVCRIAVCLLVLGLIVPAATAHLDHSDAEESSVDLRFMVESGDWAEFNMAMAAGDMIVWDVQSLNGRSFYMDLHSHSGNEVENHEEYPSTQGEAGPFTAPRDGGYSILVEREDPGDVEIRLRVQGEFDETGREGIEPLEGEPEESALPGIIGLFALATVVLVAGRRRNNLP